MQKQTDRLEDLLQVGIFIVDLLKCVAKVTKEDQVSLQSFHLISAVGRPALNIIISRGSLLVSLS